MTRLQHNFNLKEIALDLNLLTTVDILRVFTPWGNI